MENQQKVWNNIAEDWSKFRKKPRKEILKFLKEQSGKILDLGSGSGRNLIKLKNIKMYEVDFSKKMLEFGKQKAEQQKINAEFIQAPANKLPFKKEFFDAGIYVSSLHCLNSKVERKQSLKELFRVLKKGAQAYVSVWDFNSKRFGGKKQRKINWRNKGIRYYYFYEKKELEHLLKSNGFKIIKQIPDKDNIIFIIEK